MRTIGILSFACLAGVLTAGAGEVLPEPVRGALAERFPGARVLRHKAKPSAKTYELELADALNNAESYKVVIAADGGTLKEQKHRVAQQHLPKAVREAFRVWVGKAKGGGAWVVRREKGQEREFSVEKRDAAGKRFKATFGADGTLVKGDDFPGGRRPPAPGRLAQTPSPRGKERPKTGPTAQPRPQPPKPDRRPKPTPQAAAGDGGDKPDEIDPDVLRKVRKLIRKTLDEDAEEREKAWKELRDMGNLIVPGLLTLYRKGNITPPMVRSILIALGDSKDARAGPALVEVTDDKDPAIRRDAARAIGASGYKGGIPALKKRFEDPKEGEDVRLYAATAAAKLGSEDGLSALRGLLKSPKAATRARAVFALGAHGGKAQIATIAPVIDDEDRGVREDAIEALRRIGGPEVAGPLVKALRDEHYKIRNLAMEVLGEVTKQRFGRDAKAWKEWWARQQSGKKKGKDG